MTQTLTFATVGLVTALLAGTASAQSAPAANPHAGHTMPAQASPAANPHAGHTMPADPHAGHSMPAPAAGATNPHSGHSMTASPHAGHDMSAMTGMSVPAPTGTALKASSPAAGAMLGGSPRNISLTLPHAMKMDAVVLTNAAGQRIPLAATLSEAPVETLTTPVPTLPAGTYTVAWTASAGASHTMSGTFAFMVH